MKLLEFTPNGIIFLWHFYLSSSAFLDRRQSLDLYRICKDCQLTEKVIFKKFAISRQDIHIAFTSELKIRSDSMKHEIKSGAVAKKDALSKALTYAEFLNVLGRLSLRVYPDAVSQSSAFQTLLIENILPLAHRRSPQTITGQLNSSKVLAVQIEFRDALLELYTFFASESQDEDHETRAIDVKATSFQSMDSQKNRVRVYKRESVIFCVNSTEYGTTKSLAHQHWMKFAADFGLSSSVLLTQIEVSDIYLSSVVIQGKSGTPGRKMRFDQFWEAIVRCALLAWRNVATATSDSKIRALLVFMWKHFQEKTNEMNISSRDMANDLAVHNRGLVKAAEKLMAKVVTMWSDSGYRDFLQPTKPNGSLGAMVDLSGNTSSIDVLSHTNPFYNGRAGAVSAILCPVVILLEDSHDLGDARISIENLRELLFKKPELGKFLKTAIDRALGKTKRVEINLM